MKMAGDIELQFVGKWSRLHHKKKRIRKKYAKKLAKEFETVFGFYQEKVESGFYEREIRCRSQRV